MDSKEASKPIKQVFRGIFQCVFVATVTVYEPSRFGDYVFSTSAESVGWFLATVSLFVIPLCALCSIVRSLIKKQVSHPVNFKFPF